MNYTLKTLFVLLILLFIGCDSELKKENAHLKKQVTELQAMVDSLSNTPLNRFARASSLQEKKLYDRALAEYESIVKLFPFSPESKEAKKKIDEIKVIINAKIAEKQTRERRLAQDIYFRVDRVEGITWYFAKGSEDWWEKYDSYCGVYPYISKREDGTIWLRFYCGAKSAEPLFFNEIVFLVDGVRIRFPVDASNRKSEMVSMDRVKEWVNFPVDSVMLEQLKKIASGDSVTVRFSGETYHRDFDLTSFGQDEEIQNIQTILDYYYRLKQSPSLTGQ